jgi:glutamate racemase
MERYKNFVCDATCPIGIFDSGLGGLTVQKEVSLQLPREDTVYFGDSGRAPYGTKSRETILSFAKQDTRFLLEQKVKMIVIACNTASAHAYKEIAAAVNIPVIEVISPGALAAVASTKNGRIGVIGTTATVDSKVYVEAILNAAETMGLTKKVKVFQQACPLFVSLAEEGWWDNEVALLTAKAYLSPLKEKGVDTLVLGCTHYPLLQKTIQKVMGPDVTLINSANEVAKTIAKVLKGHSLENPDAKRLQGTRSFFTSDSEEKFKSLGGGFLDKVIERAKKIEIEKY